MRYCEVGFFFREKTKYQKNLKLTKETDNKKQQKTFRKRRKKSE